MLEFRRFEPTKPRRSGPRFASRFLATFPPRPGEFHPLKFQQSPNGLALSPVYDKAFDAGLITFSDCGDIVVSARLAHDAGRLGISGRERIVGLSAQHQKYLEYHRLIKFCK